MKVKSGIILTAILLILLLCLYDGRRFKDGLYVRCKGQDIALFQNEEGCSIFLPSYADASDIRMSRKIKELEPVIYESAGLPAIFIMTLSGNMDAVYADKENKEPGKIFIYDTNGNTIYKGGLEYIKGRGNYSWNTDEWEKKPFSIRTVRKSRLLSQGEGNSYALIANASDDTLIRNDIARHIQEELGVRYAKRGDFADLYINGEYQGIYYLCAALEAGDERIDIKEVNTDITGGYIIERELPDRFKLETEKNPSCFITKGDEHFVIKFPKYATDEQIKYLSDYMNKAESVIMSGDDTDKVEDNYKEYIDEESFLLTYLTEEIIKNYDGGVSSAFFYKDSDSVDNKLYCAPGWDYDMSMGSYQNWMQYDDPEVLTLLYPHEDASKWYSQLYKREGFYEKVRVKYRESRDAIEDILCGEDTDILRGRLRYAYELEYIRWKDMYDNRGVIPGSDEAYGRLTGFARARMDYLDSIWNTE